jgi:hypothetical protein
MEMCTMFRDSVDFLWALWREWKTLLTGGSIIALLFLWQIATRKIVSQNINWLIVGLTLILAAFLSWRRLWVRDKSQFVDVRPAELVAFFNDRTELHAKLHTRPYIGKRVKIAARINAVSSDGMVQIITTDGVRIHAFAGWWRAKEFALWATESELIVTGRIRLIDAIGIDLAGIEVLGVAPDKGN